jgi:hypothetical protein
MQIEQPPIIYPRHDAYAMLLSCFRPKVHDEHHLQPRGMAAVLALEPTQAEVKALVAEIASIVHDEQRLKIVADPTLAVPRRKAQSVAR